MRGSGKRVSADVAKSEYAERDGGSDGMIDLKDTVDDMLSDDYKDRLRAEYRQLTARLGRPKATLGRMDAGTLRGQQASAMSVYARILRERAAIEGVELNG